MKKINTTKLLMVFALVAFCLSNATMGKLITHGHEVHFVHDTVHVHHTANEDHGSGETDHKDAKDILSFDYLPIKSSNFAKTMCTFQPCLFSHFSLQPGNRIIHISSKNLHFVSSHRSYSPGKIYQLNSIYLI
ncbi:MAG: hypothetical protein FJ264_06970 [Planctomycetes bacterium]|nr:hypothetical protein [Planctomycetota bacterium]